MSIAQIADVTAYGFRDEQFGTPGDWSDSGGYIDTILEDAKSWARPAVGSSVYDTAESAGSGSNWQAIRQAEKYFTVAELYRRRAAWVDSAAFSSENEAQTALIEQYEKSAKRYDDMAKQALARVSGGDPTSGSGLAVSHVETGPYADADIS